MCGSFTCSKNSLIALNILYMVVAIILMILAGYANYASIVTSISIVSGIVICSVFLLLISIVGLVGASKHNQVVLFFYMIVLFIIFIIQFSVACACLAFNEEQQNEITKNGWKISTKDVRMNVQEFFQCCGYDDFHIVNETDKMYHPTCDNIFFKDGVESKCCTKDIIDAGLCCNDEINSTCSCPTCDGKLQEAIHRGLSAVGGVGLFFSFTEFLGVWLTIRFRNQRDPRANPSAFL